VAGAPIIDAPEVAMILDVGRAVVKRRSWSSATVDDSIAIRPISYLCMSWDHRALDGVEAGAVPR